MNINQKNLESILRDYIAEGSVEVNQQRELIIRKINTSDEKGLEDDSHDQDEDEEDDDEEVRFLSLGFIGWSKRR